MVAATALVAALAVIATGARAQRFREDGRCGPGNLAPDGLDAACDRIDPYPTCCQRDGHCGWECDHIGEPASLRGHYVLDYSSFRS